MSSIIIINFIISTSTIMYGLFQTHLLPSYIGKYVGRIFFRATQPLTLLSRYNNYWTQIDKNIILGASPILSLNHIDYLVNLNVKAIINLQDEFEGYTEIYKSKNINQLYLPTIDHDEPSYENIIKAIEFIKKNKEQDIITYIHCKSGNGRAATIVFAWLLLEKELNLKETQEYINSLRLVRKTIYTQKNIKKFYNNLDFKFININNVNNIGLI